MYSILPDADLAVDIDLCGSLYDTKAFVCDQDVVLVTCNDDDYGGPPCGAFVSKIENLPVNDGVEYFIVVAGYGSAARDAEREYTMFELWLQDRYVVQVAQQVTFGPCAAATMTVVGEPGFPVWFRVGPTSLTSPDGAYPYEFDDLLELNVDLVSVRDRSWTAVKALFE